MGDETDQYFGSQYGKDPSIHFSAAEEIDATKRRMKLWYRAFPKMKVCISNHGLRWAKKAFDAEIPSQMLRPYQELIEAPAGWKWAEEWIIRAKYPFRVIHGMGYSGASGARNAAVDAKMSTAIGHLHSHAGVTYIETQGHNQTLWGMNVGCLIDPNSFAFHYGKYARNKPILSIGVVLDDGKTALVIPM